MEKIKIAITRWVLSLMFNKYKRIHIWQTFFVRINKLEQLKIENKFWDAYYYDDDIAELKRLQNLFRVKGKHINDFEP